jgi:hypothetical protein
LKLYIRSATIKGMPKFDLRFYHFFCSMPLCPLNKFFHFFQIFFVGHNLDFFLRYFLNIFSVPLPCIMSDWTNWSDVDATGSSYRYRYVLRPALNGGKACKDLLQLKKGICHSRFTPLYQFTSI